MFLCCVVASGSIIVAHMNLLKGNNLQKVNTRIPSDLEKANDKNRSTPLGILEREG